VRIDDIGPAAQVAQAAHLAQRLRNHVRQRSGQRHPHHGALGHMFEPHPAQVPMAARIDRDGSRVDRAVALVDAVDGAHGQEAQPFGPGQRRPISEFENQAIGHAIGRALAHRQRRQAIAVLEHVIEAPHAAEARRQRHFCHRQRGVGQQALGQQQLLRLRVFMHRYAELGVEQPPKVAFRHADARGQLGHASAGHEAIVDQRGGGLRQPPGDIRQAMARGQFRPTAQAWPEAMLFRSRGGLVERAVFALRRAHRADRPAVHARRRHAHEEASIEAAVV